MADIVERLRGPAPLHWEAKEAAAEITALRAENSSLSAWQCVYTDGKTGLVGDEHGNQYCAMAKRVEVLRAENERLKEWNREIALNAREFAAENERLRAALEAIATGRVIEVPHVQAIARAALEETKHE